MTDRITNHPLIEMLNRMGFSSSEITVNHEGTDREFGVTVTTPGGRESYGTGYGRETGLEQSIINSLATSINHLEQNQETPIPEQTGTVADLANSGFTISSIRQLENGEEGFTATLRTPNGLSWCASEGATVDAALTRSLIGNILKLEARISAYQDEEASILGMYTQINGTDEPE